MSSKRNAAKSVGVVFILSLAASLLSFVCEMLFASHFGVSAETDAFAIASQIPVILFAVVTSSISTTVVPVYSKLLHKEGSERSQQFVSRFSALIACVSAALVAVCVLFAPAVVRLFSPGVEAEVFACAVKYIRFTFPIIIFTGLMSTYMGVLQVHGRFAKSSVLTVIRQCVYACCIVLLHKYVGIYAAVFGLLLSSVCEFLVSFIFVSLEIKIKPDFHFNDPSILEAVKMSGPIFIGIGAAEINQAVNKIVASFLEAGSISMLNYASKLSGAFTSLLTTAISTVMFPYFAEKAAKNDRKGLSEIFFLTLKAYLILTVPIIVGGVVLRQELVEAAFLRGAFTKENALSVAGLFAGYLFSMIFSAIRQTGAKLFYAQGNTKTPMLNTVIGIGINIALNIVLGHYMGAMGLVYATVISTAVISVLLMISARSQIDTGLWKGFFATLLKVFLSSAGMAAVLLSVLPLMSSLNTVAVLILAILAGMLVYGALLLVLGRKDLKEIMRIVKKQS